MSVIYCFIIGGDSPGCKTKRPFIAASRTSPPFPLAVYCTQAEQVSAISAVQPLVSELDLTQPLDYIAATLGQSPTVASILSNHDRFYPVVYGRHPGVYLSWENAEPEVTGCGIRKFQRVKTFADSLVFMITKGEHHAVDDLPALKLPSPSLRMLSPKHEFPSLQSLGGKAQLTSAADLRLNFAMHDMSISQTVDRSSNNSSSSRSLPHAHSSLHSPSYIHHLVRTLAGVVDSVSVATQTSTGDAHGSEDFPPSGILGIDAERYLHAHGYKASAVWSIIHAFKDAYGPDDFMAYVCPKGMPMLEAAYIYELISGRDVWLANDA
ncbi:hypothetical protein CY34DRAFT_18626 [Suillus luteus UH-Slu-Lm8-n1]|uniref:Ribonuclease H1 N-terminal domain-containing protein n=1 Tax=Suillus luteus UH-Slu-Lm8-n1 TaxID=930992 RepID=A0A0C9Z6F1_9AGAM|nr:hypothetical protein CY34DRAFT_18626 [Suillus luteus UH-Slu-Lm8-n1]